MAPPSKCRGAIAVFKSQRTIAKGRKYVLNAIPTLVIAVVIGIAAGLLINHHSRGWFRTRASDVTAALVGIAGAFIGFYIIAAVGLARTPLTEYLGAIAGAFPFAGAFTRRIFPQLEKDRYLRQCFRISYCGHAGSRQG